IYGALIPPAGEISPSHWTLLSDDAGWSHKPCWSSDGRQLFYASERDGFLCIWKRHLDGGSLAPAGPPQPVYHFHRGSFSPMHLSRAALGLAAARDWLYVNVSS